MWSMPVVVDSPGFDDATSLGESREDVIVQALVAKLSVEALDERILRRLDRRDVMQFYASSQ